MIYEWKDIGIVTCVFLMLSIVGSPILAVSAMVVWFSLSECAKHQLKMKKVSVQVSKTDR